MNFAFAFSDSVLAAPALAMVWLLTLFNEFILLMCVPGFMCFSLVDIMFGAVQSLDRTAEGAPLAAGPTVVGLQRRRSSAS